MKKMAADNAMTTAKNDPLLDSILPAAAETGELLAGGRELVAVLDEDEVDEGGAVDSDSEVEEASPSVEEAGPSVLDDGSSVLDAGPSVLDAGSSGVVVDSSALDGVGSVVEGVGSVADGVGSVVDGSGAVVLGGATVDDGMTGAVLVFGVACEPVETGTGDTT